jgi:hypothetical protein
MTIKTRLVIAAVAITCTIATIAYATPIVGLLGRHYSLLWHDQR